MDIGELWMSLAFIELSLGENFCNGIPLGNNFNDKESLTADNTDPTGNLVYAVWDRLVSPNENVPASAFENAHAYTGPAWFARTTNGAAASAGSIAEHAVRSIEGATREGGRGELYTNLDKFVEVLQKVDENYVEPIDESKLREAAIEARGDAQTA